MSFNSVVEMASNTALMNRIVAAVAREGISNPQQWTTSYLWKICASPGWDTAWDAAIANNLPDQAATNIRERNLGSHEGVITDSMILTAVQSMTASST